MKLARVIYLSAAQPDLDYWQAAAEIVGASQAGNTRDELTGVLLAHNGWFVQCLEGLPGRLSRLLLRIGADSRHRQMQFVEFNEVEHRRFADWAMAHVAFAPRIADQVGDDFDPRLYSAQDLLALLTRADRAVRSQAA